MKIFVTVKTRARKISVVKIDPVHFKVSVKEPPIDGKANEAVIEAMADYFNMPPSQITLLSGHRSKQKILSW